MGEATYIDSSESRNWNSAKIFSQIKIAKPLAELDEYEKMALFGTSDMVDEFSLDENTKNQARIKALERICHTLQMLVRNTIFAVNKKDRPKMEGFTTRLERLWKVLPVVKNETVNHRDRKTTVTIDEKKFKYIFDLLLEIKQEVNYPLNQANLIFSSDDSIDPDELMRRIEDDMIHSG